MSDYISKSALIEEVGKIETNFYFDKKGKYNPVLKTMKILNCIEEQPTISETEIIRKAFDRVVERLEENAQKMSEAKAIRPYAKHSPADHRYYKAISVKKAIQIIKKECGISE